ncbi:hypothetical protein L0F63_004976 [Massospora cicadina]|nr:hypothetical protein L0F63_004976 [Massospora cicadina]
MSIGISHRRAKDAIQRVVSTLQANSQATHASLASLSHLPALRNKVEATLAKYIGNLLMYDQFLKQPLVSDLAPHVADHPTHLLSSLAHALANEAYETENEPPNPPSPSAMHQGWAFLD